MIRLRLLSLNTVWRRCAVGRLDGPLVREPFYHPLFPSVCEFSSRNTVLPEDYQVPINIEKQTFLHKDGGYRLSGLPNGDLFVGKDQTPVTMFECLHIGAKRSSHGQLLGRKTVADDGTTRYEWITYKEAIKRCENIAAAMLTLGVVPGQDTRIGIFSINRPEWFLVEHASYVYNMVCVPIFANFGSDACKFVIKHTKMPLIVCDSQAKAKDLLDHGAELEEFLKHIIIMDVFDVELRNMGKKHGINVISFAELELLGHNLKSRPQGTPPKLTDLATICYTSGTTGTPKGVMVTHSNMSAVLSISNVMSHKIDDSITYLSYMPAAHMFERIASKIVVLKGGRLGYYSGNTQLILDDLRCLKPTYIITVPRIFNKVYSQVVSNVTQFPSSLIKYPLFKLAVNYKKLCLFCGYTNNRTWADKVFFDKIRIGVFGGNIEMIIVGSAPLGGEVLSFFRVALGCSIREGYGQTESTASGTLTLSGDNSLGHVGSPYPGAEIKIIDVPHMNFKADVNGGEILIRGPTVTKGYFMDPKLTAKTFDSEGWLHTGDIGKFNEQGSLQLLDRIKNIIKLPNGEFLIPEKIERNYLSSPFVEQIYIHGDSKRNDVVGVVVVVKEFLLQFAKVKLHLADLSFDELRRNKKVQESILKDLHRIGEDNGHMRYEQVRRIWITGTQFSVENDLLTPTLKNKRAKIFEKYEKAISNMYDKVERDRRNGKITS